MVLQSHEDRDTVDGQKINRTVESEIVFYFVYGNHEEEDGR